MELDVADDDNHFLLACFVSLDVELDVELDVGDDDTHSFLTCTFRTARYGIRLYYVLSKMMPEMVVSSSSSSYDLQYLRRF